ncbi:MAG TPA: EamA family transporter RarD [Luteolibacter sp.]
MDRTRSGVVAALAAFFLWGVLPVFWKHLAFLPAPSIVAQRTLWSLLLLLPLVWFRRERAELVAGMKCPATFGWHALSGSLLASNWLLYVWATLHGHIVEGALGYYLNPFFNMLFGALWFGERHNRLQLAAIGLAVAGLGFQIPAVSGFPWISVSLAVTFALYAVVRKKAPLGALSGLVVETVLLSPVALVWLTARSASLPAAFGGSPGNAALVIATGAATATPLLFFGYAARTIRLTTLGILQFLGPTLQFLIGWKLYGEPMSALRLVSFAFIWLAIGVYAWDAWRGRTVRSE